MSTPLSELEREVAAVAGGADALLGLAEDGRADGHGEGLGRGGARQGLTDEELELTRRFRNCAKFAERLTEHDAEGHVADVSLVAGDFRYRIRALKAGE